MDEEGNIISKKQIGANWNVDLTQEPREQHDIFTQKNREITETLTSTYKHQLRRTDVSELLDDVRAKKCLIKG